MAVRNVLFKAESWQSLTLEREVDIPDNLTTEAEIASYLLQYQRDNIDGADYTGTDDDCGWENNGGTII